MAIIIPGEDNTLQAAGYPVTRVYCDGRALVCYERDGAAPIRLNEVSPSRSRKAALERCIALLDMVPDERAVERDFPISSTGHGLTRNQLKAQTMEACMRSREIEKKLKNEFDAKVKRRRR